MSNFIDLFVVQYGNLFFFLLCLHFAAFLLCSHTLPHHTATTSQSFRLICEFKIFSARLAELLKSVKFTWILIFIFVFCINTLLLTDHSNEPTVYSAHIKLNICCSEQCRNPLMQGSFTFLSAVWRCAFLLQFYSVEVLFKKKPIYKYKLLLSVCTGSGNHSPLELLLVSSSACFCLSSLCVINTHSKTAKLRYVTTQTQSL